MLDAQRIRAFWQMDRLGNVPLALIGAVGALMLLGNPFRISPEGSHGRFYLAFTAGALAVSWLNRAAAGGFLLSFLLARRWRDLIEWGVIAGVPFAVLQILLRVTLGAWGHRLWWRVGYAV